MTANEPCVYCGATISGNYQLVYDEEQDVYLGTICFECYVCWYQEEDRLQKVIEFTKKHPNAAII